MADKTLAELPTAHLPTLERMAVDKALAECGGNRTRSAKVLGISVRTLQVKLRKWGSVPTVVAGRIGR